MTYTTWLQERQSYNAWAREFIARCKACEKHYDIEYMIGEYCAYCYGKERHAEEDTDNENTNPQA